MRNFSKIKKKSGNIFVETKDGHMLYLSDNHISSLSCSKTIQKIKKNYICIVNKDYHLYLTNNNSSTRIKNAKMIYMKESSLVTIENDTFSIMNENQRVVFQHFNGNVEKIVNQYMDKKTDKMIKIEDGRISTLVNVSQLEMDSIHLKKISKNRNIVFLDFKFKWQNKNEFFSFETSQDLAEDLLTCRKEYLAKSFLDHCKEFNV